MLLTGNEEYVTCGTTPEPGFHVELFFLPDANKAPKSLVYSNYFQYSASVGKKVEIYNHYPNGGISFTFPTSKFANQKAFKA